MTFRTLEISPPSAPLEGLRFVTAKSPALHRRADLTLWEPAGVPPGSCPLVILLHGVYGSHWAWALKGGAHRTAARLIESGAIGPVALAMPSDGLWGDGSGYVSHPDADYERWIIDEVPEIARQVLGSVGVDSGIYLSGLSMGGFGAMRLGAIYGERVRGISGHSSVTAIEQLSQFMEEPVSDLERGGAPISVIEAIRARAGKLPPIRFDCGTEDPLIGPNRELHRALEAEGIPHVYEEFPGGHEWDYWTTHLADSLRFFAGIELRSLINIPGFGDCRKL